MVEVVDKDNDSQDKGLLWIFEAGGWILQRKRWLSWVS